MKCALILAEYHKMSKVHKIERKRAYAENNKITNPGNI